MKNTVKSVIALLCFILAVNFFFTNAIAKSTENKPIIIKFIAPVNQSSILLLLDTIDKMMKKGHTDFVLLISSPGGSVFYGLTAYNYLKGVPANIVTHNIGSVDSIGIILYCAGDTRLSVPHARFLIHGVQLHFKGQMTFEQPLLEEKLKGLEIDHENIAKVIASTINQPIEKVKSAILERTVLSPDEACEWGLVNDIKSDLYEKDSIVISITPLNIQRRKTSQSQSVIENNSIDIMSTRGSLNSLYDHSSYPREYTHKSETFYER